jgi:hypothetical protein
MNTFKCFLLAHAGVFIFILACILFVVSCIQIDGGDFDDMLDMFKQIFTTTTPLIVFGILMVIGIFFSVKIAGFARENFDEVVSRRMKFRSSRVDLYEEGLAYWLINFFNSMIAFAIVSLILIILCKDIILD